MAPVVALPKAPYNGGVPRRPMGAAKNPEELAEYRREWRRKNPDILDDSEAKIEGLLRYKRAHGR